MGRFRWMWRNVTYLCDVVNHVKWCHVHIKLPIDILFFFKKIDWFSNNIEWRIIQFPPKKGREWCPLKRRARSHWLIPRPNEMKYWYQDGEINWFLTGISVWNGPETHSVPRSQLTKASRSRVSFVDQCERAIRQLQLKVTHIITWHLQTHFVLT